MTATPKQPQPAEAMVPTMARDYPISFAAILRRDLGAFSLTAWADAQTRARLKAQQQEGKA